MNNLPDFMIIGAMKCATSTLHEQLARQPGIVMSEPKELYFFSDMPVYAKGMMWYSRHFEGKKSGELAGESTTHYTKLPTYPGTAARIQKHVPDAKFIYVMRHPIDRLVSQYIHQWTEKEIKVDIETAVDQHPELIAYSRYAMQLEPFFELFGRERVLPVFFDRLRTYPQKELERICHFIGYDNIPLWDYGDEARNVSAERMQANPLRDKIVYSKSVIFIRKKLVPQSARDKVKTLWQMQDRPELSDGRRRYLAQLFDQELAILGTWLGMDGLHCATFKEITREQSFEWV